MVAVPSPSGEGFAELGAEELDTACPGERDAEEVRQAFVALVRTARRLSPRDAEDLAQEAMARAVAHGVAPDALPWLRTVVRHLVIDQARRPRELASGDSSDLEELCAPITADPSDSAVSRVHQNQVREALARMPRRYREAVLALVDSQDAAEVARRFGVSHQAAWSLLSRARRRLRLELKRVGYMPSVLAGRLSDYFAPIAPGVALGVAATIAGVVGVAAPAAVPSRPAGVVHAAAHTPADIAPIAAHASAKPFVPAPVARAAPEAPVPEAGRVAARYGAEVCAAEPAAEDSDLAVHVGVSVIDDDNGSLTGRDQSYTVEAISQLPSDLRSKQTPECGA